MICGLCGRVVHELCFLDHYRAQHLQDSDSCSDCGPDDASLPMPDFALHPLGGTTTTTTPDSDPGSLFHVEVVASTIPLRMMPPKRPAVRRRHAGTGRRRDDWTHS